MPADNITTEGGCQKYTLDDVADCVYFVPKEDIDKTLKRKYDYIVIGTGPCAYAFVDAILKETVLKSSCNILVIERGGLFLQDHAQALEPVLRDLLGGTSETFPFTLTKEMKSHDAKVYAHGSVNFIGGRSTVWTAWSPFPELKDPTELRGFGEHLIEVQNYRLAAEQCIGADAPSNASIFKPSALPFSHSLSEYIHERRKHIAVEKFLAPDTTTAAITPSFSIGSDAAVGDGAAYGEDTVPSAPAAAEGDAADEPEASGDGAASVDPSGGDEPDLKNSTQLTADNLTTVVHKAYLARIAANRENSMNPFGKFATVVPFLELFKNLRFQVDTTDNWNYLYVLHTAFLNKANVAISTAAISPPTTIPMFADYKRRLRECLAKIWSEWIAFIPDRVLLKDLKDVKPYAKALYMKMAKKHGDPFKQLRTPNSHHTQAILKIINETHTQKPEENTKETSDRKSVV